MNYLSLSEITEMQRLIRVLAFCFQYKKRKLPSYGPLLLTKSIIHQVFTNNFALINHSCSPDLEKRLLQTLELGRDSCMAAAAANSSFFYNAAVAAAASRVVRTNLLLNLAVLLLTRPNR